MTLQIFVFVYFMYVDNRPIPLHKELVQNCCWQVRIICIIVYKDWGLTFKTTYSKNNIFWSVLLNRTSWFVSKQKLIIKSHKIFCWILPLVSFLQILHVNRSNYRRSMLQPTWFTCVEIKPNYKLFPYFFKFLHNKKKAKLLQLVNTA